MSNSDYAVTFACYNQLKYTRMCVDSMLKHGFDLRKLVVVDNGSTDGTREYLQALPLGGCIFNRENMGCGVAWNQGSLALQAEWTIIMNNDILVSAGWVDNLVAAAETEGLKVISPAMIEGDLDYDFDSFAVYASDKMRNVFRKGDVHAVCLAVHHSVWMEVGYFRAEPKLFGYEDTLFFHELQKAGIPRAITGASWLHHFGSVTQAAMKEERGFSQKEGLGNPYNYRLLNISWKERKLRKWRQKRQQKKWRRMELENYRMSVYGVRNNGQFRWL